MHQLPYQFHGLLVLSTILFVFALLIIIVVTAVHLLRVFMFPKSALKQTISDPNSLCLWGCAPIALLTITSQVSLTVSAASWGHAFTLVAYVMWWIATFLMVSTSLIVYITFADLQLGKDLHLPSSIFIPAVGTCTNALIGAVVATYSYDISPRLAVPVIVTSWILLGYGMFLALIVYAMFLQSLFIKGIWQPPALWPSFLLLTGPMGQSASAIQFLGVAASQNFPGYDKGTFLTSMASTSVSSYSIVLGLMFLGFDLFWLFFGIYILIKGTIQGKLSFSMTWWSTIFPVATINISFLSLSTSMDSPAFRVLTTGLLIILIIDYFACWAFMIRDIFAGKILDGRKELAEMVKKQD